jgi:hypothetical protein
MTLPRIIKIIMLLFISFFFTAPGFSESSVDDSRATVKIDSLEVHSEMSENSRVLKSLKKGDIVNVEVEIEGSAGKWCGITEEGQPDVIGYVLCRDLNQKVSQGKSWQMIEPKPQKEKAQGAQRPALKQLLDEAHRSAAAGNAYDLNIEGKGIFTFYNNPRPFCYTYMIPGDWKPGEEAGLYRSKDGRAVVGVLFWPARNLERTEGANLVERASKNIVPSYEKRLGQSLTGVELMPFESARPGTWKLKAATVKQEKLLISLPTKIIVDLSPDAVVVITAGGTIDDDGLARRIIKTIRTTSNPECYFPLLETMLKAMGFR